jgi:hypothetical protein
MFIFYCVRMIDFSIDIFGNLRIVFTLWDRVFLNVFLLFLWNFIYIYIKISIGFWLCYVIILENIEKNIWNICKIIIKFIRLKASLLNCINLEFLFLSIKI